MPNDNSSKHQPSWVRPTPNIGDVSSALERGELPSAWAFETEAIQAIANVISARRDIRKFRPDPIPDELLTQVLQAGHQGPSVGHSQPWRFIVVSEAATRDQAAVMADRERLRQAELLTEDRKTRLLDLKLEGIREAPLGIVVACDRRTPASGVLGRNTFTDTDVWSCACAIENMWLMARSLGLGMGWVTLFQPNELADLLGLPEGVESLGWLCLGWPDERPPAPGLERRGWSKRMPLEEVVLAERWDGTTPPPISALKVESPTQQEVVSGYDEADQLLTPPGSLGLLDQSLDKLVAAATDQVSGGTLVIVGADHPVCAHHISAFDQSITAEVMSASAAGVSLGAATAKTVGLEFKVVDAGVNAGPISGADFVGVAEERGDLVNQNAMSVDAAQQLIDAGREYATQLSDGLVCLGEIGIGNTTVAAALASALLGLPAEEVVGLGAGSDSDMVQRKAKVIEQANERLADADLADPLTALAAVGGPEFAFLTGLVLGAAEAKRPVILDGLATSVAALAAVRLSPAVQSWLIASHQSRESAHGKVLTELGLEPLFKLRFRAGEGVGACYGAQMLLTGLQVRRTAARWTPPAR